VAACDTPFLPPDWVARLLAGAAPSGTVPIIHAIDPKQPHPLVAVLHRRVLPSLEAFLEGGNHRVRQWYGEQGARTVRFDEPDAFLNLNTPEDWQQAEARLARGGACHAPVRPPY